MDTGSTSPEKPGSRTFAYVLLAAGVILIALGFFIGIVDNAPGIVSMLVGFLSLALGIIFSIAKSGQRKPAQQLLYWAPRALCIVFALFISIFAMDVFSEGKGLWSTLLDLLMHLIPTFLLLALLAVSWRREWIAGILFPLLGVVYVVWAWGKPFAVWSTLAIMAGPLVLTGALFLLNWFYRGELRGKA